MIRQHPFVCGNHVFARLKRAQHVIICRIHAADDFDNRVDLRICENFIERLRLKRPQFRTGSARQHALYLNIRALGELLHYAAADNAHAQQTNFHAITAFFSFRRLSSGINVYF